MLNRRNGDRGKWCFQVFTRDMMTYPIRRRSTIREAPMFQCFKANRIENCINRVNCVNRVNYTIYVCFLNLSWILYTLTSGSMVIHPRH